MEGAWVPFRSLEERSGLRGVDEVGGCETAEHEAICSCGAEVVETGEHDVDLCLGVDEISAAGTDHDVDGDGDG